jgi:hypothetical protein
MFETRDHAAHPYAADLLVVDARWPLCPITTPISRITDASGTKANVWATIGPAGVPGTILSGHTDVVPVDGQSWKGFGACCLAAVPDMLAVPLVRPIHLARVSVHGKSCHSSLAPQGVMSAAPRP